MTIDLENALRRDLRAEYVAFDARAEEMIYVASRTDLLGARRAWLAPAATAATVVAVGGLALTLASHPGPPRPPVPAGGAEHMATLVQQLRAKKKNSVFVAAGDLIGASPLLSALFHDEPTMALLNELGVSASTVGNHEFDEGYRELLRMQFGGCHPTDGCQFRDRYPGARFPFLGANVSFDNGLPAVLPFTVEVVGGVPVGIIGVTLKDLPLVVTPEAIKGLKFGDEVKAPAQDEEFVLSHSDNVQATGFVEHLKLPHYVDFQSELGLVRRLRAEFEALRTAKNPPVQEAAE